MSGQSQLGMLNNSGLVFQLALRLSELGWLYNRVNAFCEHKSSDRELGLVGQSLITGLRNELTEFYRLLSILEAQLKTGGGPGCGMGLTMHQVSYLSTSL